MAEKQEDKKTVKKFNPKKAIERVVKEQPGSDYAVELLLDPEDAESFEYLSEWVVNKKTYRVVARLNKPDGKILVQAKFVPIPPKLDA